MVTSNSPPCLVFQGAKDGLVDPAIALHLRDVYLQNANPHCAVILIPFAKHGSDMLFSSSFNQVFIYYMERFMAQYQPRREEGAGNG